MLSPELRDPKPSCPFLPWNQPLMWSAPADETKSGQPCVAENDRQLETAGSAANSHRDKWALWPPLRGKFEGRTSATAPSWQPSVALVHLKRRVWAVTAEFRPRIVQKLCYL